MNYIFMINFNNCFVYMLYTFLHNMPVFLFWNFELDFILHDTEYLFRKKLQMAIIA